MSRNFLHLKVETLSFLILKFAQNLDEIDPFLFDALTRHKFLSVRP